MVPLSQIPSPILAFPRNFLHVHLLEDNLPSVDYILYRELFMRPRLEKTFPEDKLIYIGREMRPGLNGWNLAKIIAHNRRYYPKTLDIFRQLNPKTIILFLENEPLEVALTDDFGLEICELWEEGVMHYVDMFNPVFFRLRRLVQISMGFYAGHPFRLRLPREKMTVRDRFEQKNLTLSRPIGSGKARDDIAFIANVISGDGLKTKAQYLQAIHHLADTSIRPIVYLPHPREDSTLVRAIKSELQHPNLLIEKPRQGTLQYCVDYDFHAYISPFSTTLLDLQKFDKSYWIPEFFGLKSYTKALRRTRQFPVRLLTNTDLESMLIH